MLFDISINLGEGANLKRIDILNPWENLLPRIQN